MKKTTRTSARKRATAADTVETKIEKDVDQVDAEVAESTEDGPSEKSSNALKLRDLIEKVVDATGAKKKNAKEIVEATLTLMGEALSNGQELNLPGFGKVRVQKTASKGDGQATMTLKMRSMNPQRKKDEAEALAPAEEAV